MRKEAMTCFSGERWWGLEESNGKEKHHIKPEGKNDKFCGRSTDLMNIDIP